MNTPYTKPKTAKPMTAKQKAAADAKRKRQWNRAQDAAIRRLIENHKDEYKEIMNEERAKRGIVSAYWIAAQRKKKHFEALLAEHGLRMDENGKVVPLTSNEDAPDPLAKPAQTEDAEDPWPNWG